MGSAAVSLMAFVIVFATAFTVMGNVISITEDSSQGLRVTWAQAEALAYGHTKAVSATSSSTLVLTDVDVVIENTGKTKHAPPDFTDWVVIVRYQDSLGAEATEFVPYSESVQLGTWTVEQIYLDEPTATAEIYEPGIFNPNEEMVINVRLFRLLGVGTTNIVTVVTPEGERSSVIFTG